MNNTVLAIVLVCLLAALCAAGFTAVRLTKADKRLYIIPAVFGALFAGFLSFSLASIDTLVSVELYDDPVEVYATDMVSGGYRYGPSIITDGDGNAEAFFSADYGSSVWDVITYRKSTDCGLTWGDETVSLMPVAGSDEHYSNCDPGAFKVNGYYYVGYTSTFDGRGLYNFIYCARSKTPEDSSSWEKWNGSGWGGRDPKPIITYYGTQTEYGIGEPSFVYKDGKVYVYYTYIGTLGDGAAVRQTRVAAAPMSENWCADLRDAGVVRSGRGLAEDSLDVKYVPSLGKFLAIGTDNRFSEESYVKAFISDDGVRFYEIPCNSDAAKKGLHSIGVSGDEHGHLNENNNFVMYAYTTDGTWGKWNTALTRFRLKTRRAINFRKFFPKCAHDPSGKTAEKAWGLTSVESQDSDIPAGTYSATNVLKSDETYFWSENYAESRYATALAVKTKGKVKGVKITPVATLEGVPVNFRFEYSNDGIIWRNAPCAEVTGFTADEHRAYNFPFERAVRAKYVRITVTELGKLGDTDLYALCLERMEPY